MWIIVTESWVCRPYNSQIDEFKNSQQIFLCLCVTIVYTFWGTSHAVGTQVHTRSPNCFNQPSHVSCSRATSMYVYLYISSDQEVVLNMCLNKFMRCAQYILYIYFFCLCYKQSCVLLRVFISLCPIYTFAQQCKHFIYCSFFMYLFHIMK